MSLKLPKGLQQSILQLEPVWFRLVSQIGSPYYRDRQPANCGRRLL